MITHHPSGVSYCDDCKTKLVLMDDDTHGIEDCHGQQLRVASMVTDKVIEAAPEYLHHDISADEWGYDPWGTNLSWWFTLNDFFYAVGLPTNEAYAPPRTDAIDILINSYGDNSDNFALIRDAHLDGHVTVDELQRFDAALEVADHALRIIGDGALTY